MTIPTLSTLPVAPARTDPPATFVTRADAFLAAIVTFQGEMNTSIGAMNTDIAGVNADATAAAASATAAASSATAAANAAGAALWVSGQAYAEGDAAISLVNYQTYRAETATSGTTDPSLDANWTAISGTFPVQTGNADKFLTTDGTTPSWADLPASAGSADFVATGAIGSGDTVGLRSDGTVEVISGTQVFELYSGTVTDKPSTNFREVKGVYDSVNNKIYAKWNTTTAVYVNVGTVTGSTITWGADQTVTTSKYSNSYGDSGITYDAVADRVIVFYQDGSNLPTFVAGVVTGTTIGFGTPVSLSGVNFQEARGFGFAYDTEHNVTHFSFENSSDGNASIVPVSVSGTTITLGTRFRPNTGQSVEGATVAYSESLNKIIIAAYSNGIAAYFYLLDFDGTNYTLESSATIASAGGNSGIQQCAYDDNTKTIVLVGGTSNNANVCCAQISGGAIVAGNALTGIFNSANTASVSVAFDSSSFWISAIENGGSYKLYLAEATIVSNVISVTLGGFYHDVLTGGYQLNLVSDENRIIHTLYGDTGFTEYRHVAFRKALLNTNADSYIGLANASISDGATGTINILAGTNAAQSGLTVGAEYWLKLDGTLSTSPTNYSKIGYATSATSINLAANSNEPTTVNSGSLYLPASGSLSAGDTVFYSSGQASPLITTPLEISSLAIGSGTDGSIGDTGNTPSKFITAGNKGVLFARNSSNYIVAFAFSKNASNQWVVGNRTTIYSGATYTGSNSIDGVYNPIADSFYIVFTDTSWNMRVGGCKTDGTNIFNGTQTTVSSSRGGQSHCMGIDPNTGRIVVVGHAANYGTMYWSAFTNTSGITRTNTDFDNAASGTANCSRGMDLNYIEEHDEWVFTSQNNSNQIVFARLEYSGGSGTWTNLSTFTVASDPWSDDRLCTAWSTYHDKFFVKQVFSTTRTWLRVYSYNGTTVTYTDDENLSTLTGSGNFTTNNAYPEVFCPFDSLSKIYIFTNGSLFSLDYDGSTFTFDGQSNGYAIAGTMNPWFDKTSLFFSVLNVSGTTGYPRSAEIASTNYESFLGFSSAAYLSGDLVKIDTLSAINNSQIGLTAGSSYYIGALGALTTEVGTVKAGRALTDTDILVGG